MRQGIDKDARTLLKLLKKVRSEADRPDSAIIYLRELDEAVNLTVNTLWSLESVSQLIAEAEVREAAFKAILQLDASSMSWSNVEQRVMDDEHMEIVSGTVNEVMVIQSHFNDEPVKWEVTFNGKHRVQKAPNPFYVWFHDPDELIKLGIIKTKPKPKDEPKTPSGQPTTTKP